MSLSSWLAVRPMVSWAVVFAYALLIFYLSSIPSPEQPFGLPQTASYWEHLVEYLGFGFFVSVAFRSKKLNSAVPAFLFSSIYGLTDELHQFFVPGRNASLIDFLLDVLGCLAGVLAAEYSLRRKSS